MTQNHYKIFVYILLFVIWAEALWVVRANNYYKLEKRLFLNHRHRWFTGETYYPEKEKI